jgi:hypothetical protein
MNIIVVNANLARRTEDNHFVGTNSFGDSTNYAQFSDTGVLTFHGSATGFDDIVFEMLPSRLGSLTKPDWDSTNLGFLFPQNDTTEYIDIVVQLPHRWKVGSTIYPHVHIQQAANQQAVFKLDYKWYNLGDTIPAGTSTYTMGTYVETYSSGTIAQILHGTGIAGTDKEISSLLKIRLYRDDNAYTGDILVDSFDIHIEVDSIGSDEQYTK